MNEYAIIEFAGDDEFLLYKRQELVRVTKEEAFASEDVAGVLETRQDVDAAQDGVKYAISLELLDELFGYDTTT